MKWIVASAYLLASVASAHAANQHTTKILGLTQEQQNQLFTLALKKESCDRVNRTMYQGGTSDGDDSWSVGCENGNDFSVGIPTDINAVKILTCKEMVAIGAMLARRAGQPPTSNLGCWIKFKQ